MLLLQLSLLLQAGLFIGALLGLLLQLLAMVFFRRPLLLELLLL